MAINRQKISQMNPKGSALDPTDLLEVSVQTGVGYETYSITGQEIIDGSGGIQDLQQVTDVGNNTSNDIIVEVASNSSIVSNSGVITQDTTASTLAEIISDGSLGLQTGAKEAYLKTTNVANDNVILEFPNKATGSYTIATTSDVSGYVPYTGATQDVDLGANKISAKSVYIEGTAGNGHLHLKHQSADATATGQSTSLWADTNGDVKWKNDGNYKTTLKTSTNTADRTYTFPNADCTLTPDSRTISTTAPLSGGGDLSANRTLSIAKATTSTDGYLSKADWTNFDSKQNALVSGTNIKTVQSTTLLGSGDITITDANLSMSDITTNNVSITQHGFVPKAPNDITKFLRGDGTWATAGGGGGSLTIGTTTITSGTVGRILFEGTGNVLQEDSALFWDNTNKRLGVGATPSTSVRLDVRAQGALTTDIAFRVRNSANTANLAYINGAGDIALSSATITSGTGGNGTAISIGESSQVWTGYTQYPIAIGKSSKASGNSIAIGNGAVAGDGQTLVNNIAIGSSATVLDTVTDCVALGRGATTGQTGGTIAIGSGINFGGYSGGANIAVGTYFNGGSFINGVYAFGSGVSDASRASLDIADSFSIYFKNNNRSFFVNKNTNIVLRSVSTLTSGTHFDANATNTFTIHNGTAPASSIVDAYQQYSADIVAGNAAPHFRTENGNIIKLYRETTAVASSTLVGGGGTALTDTDTFDGYTLKQIVKALRNQGLLA